MTADRGVSVGDASTAVDRGIQGLRLLQSADGSWPAPLETDASVTALHILLMYYLERVDPVLEAEMVRYIRHEQDQSGGWPGHPGGTPLLDSTILCYAALKASGAPTADPGLIRAGAVIHRCGGVGRASLVVRAFLALLGQAPLESVPHASSRLLRAPAWLHPNVGDFGVFALVVVPFGILVGRRAIRKLPRDRGIEELISESTRWRLADAGKPIVIDDHRSSESPARETAGLSGRQERGRSRPVPQAHRLKASAALLAISVASSASRLIHRLAPDGKADELAWRWIAERKGRDGTFGEACWPTMLSLMALDNEPSGSYRPIVSKGLETLNRWTVHDQRGAWLPFTQGATCMTALALVTLAEAGVPNDDPAVNEAVQWLVDHQASAGGGATGSGRGSRGPAGWYFGEDNDRFPDADDTTIVLQALLPFRNRCEEAFRRGVEWILVMEHQRGGWASYSKDGRRLPLAALGLLAPEMSDLPDEDITARVLFLLAQLRGDVLDQDNRIALAVDRGIEFLWSRMKPDGTWRGRWMVNRLYGTAQALEALARCGCVPGDPRAERSIDWLESVQNTDGGWGESKRSYVTGSYVPGPSSPLISAAVLLALVALGRQRSSVVARGINYLEASQEADGLWYDRDRSGVVFPGESYTSYHLAATCGAIVSIQRRDFP